MQVKGLPAIKTGNRHTAAVEHRLSKRLQLRHRQNAFVASPMTTLTWSALSRDRVGAGSVTGPHWSNVASVRSRNIFTARRHSLLCRRLY